MYKDNSLIPAEAVRLAALGLLATAPRAYAALAGEIRFFIARIAGPSLELLGPSLELFKIEGLIDSEPTSAPPEEHVLRLTESGRAELHRLLNAGLRGPMNEVNRLITALKLAFLDHLAPAERRRQCELLEETCEKERARLADLAARQEALGAMNSPRLASWLAQEISVIEGRRAWFRRQRDSIAD